MKYQENVVNSIKGKMHWSCFLVEYVFLCFVECSRCCDEGNEGNEGKKIYIKIFLLKISMKFSLSCTFLPKFKVTSKTKIQ